MSRRTFLAVGCLALLLTGPYRTRAAVVTEAEAAAYGGTTTGGWACGPVGRATYAGLATRARIMQGPGRHGGTGFVGDVGGAIENESVKIVDCRDANPCEGPPPTRDHLGGHARVGYLGPLWRQGPSLGIEGGFTVYQGWDDAGDRTPGHRWFPDLELGYRPPSEALRAVLGFGAPGITHYRRPGLYGGADISAGPVDVQMRVGLFRAGPATAGGAELRGDLTALVPLTDRFALRVGGSAMGGDHALGGEGQLGALLRLP